MLATYRFHFIIGIMLCATLLAGCAESQSVPTSTPTQPMSTATTVGPASEVKPELEENFQGFKGVEKECNPIIISILD